MPPLKANDAIAIRRRRAKFYERLCQDGRPVCRDCLMNGGVERYPDWFVKVGDEWVGHCSEHLPNVVRHRHAPGPWNDFNSGKDAPTEPEMPGTARKPYRPTVRGETAHVTRSRREPNKVSAAADRPPPGRITPFKGMPEPWPWTFSGLSPAEREDWVAAHWHLREEESPP